MELNKTELIRSDGEVRKSGIKTNLLAIDDIAESIKDKVFGVFDLLDTSEKCNAEASAKNEKNYGITDLTDKIGSTLNYIDKSLTEIIDRLR